ncbi:MAG: biotin/lipoyl-containing protein [Planctomycetota bacterium]|nr:biotin/lipoyl-containing protein [Planctomycetota bacterium]
MSTSPKLYEVRIPDFEIPGARLCLTGWIVGSGARVESGDPVCEICAGDIVVEIIARHGGVFHYAAVEVDDELETGTVIGMIELEVERES